MGLKTAEKPFISEELGGKVNTSESYWALEDNVLTIYLKKLYKAETWYAAFKNHGELDPFTAEQQKQKVLLERFQSENPGFDYSEATFSGMCPEPRKFMDGPSYK